jgi:hypothetical protein
VRSQKNISLSIKNKEYHSGIKTLTEEIKMIDKVISYAIHKNYCQAKLSSLQKEYRKFFRRQLKEQGVSNLGELTPNEIVLFFKGIKKDWRKFKKENKL